MMGRNLITGSHFDEYLITFTLFRAGLIADEVFSPPDVCSGIAPEQPGASGLAEKVQHQLLSLLPSTAVISAAATSKAASALAFLHSNQQLVDNWNKQPQPPFKLALNKFATWSQQQYVSTMLGQKAPAAGNRKAPRPGYLGMLRRSLPNSMLPSTVDWRGTGADGVVKDQASCGSCWAFAAAGAMSSSWFMATRQRLSLSEQQLVDCAWDLGNDGCGGGWNDRAIAYVAAAGGLALEDDYPYRGQNDFCRAANLTQLPARFKGFKEVPPRDDKALMEALYQHGPLAISIDAEAETFKFYSEGVFSGECKSDPDSLNHAVLLVGYGTSAQGEKYWLIKNSWSKFWGEDGYMKIVRGEGDCGVTTAAVVAVVEKKGGSESKE